MGDDGARKFFTLEALRGKFGIMLPRKIVHIDMYAFYVEQRDDPQLDPQLRGEPVIVARRGNRSVVCALVL